MNTAYYVAGIPYSAELYHHGIKGQKWGVRRYQNDDGTLTGAGKARYSTGDSEHDLGLGNKKRLNSIEKNFVRDNKAFKKAEDNMYRKAAKAQFKGKDPTRYMNAAKQFANQSSMIKKMNESYQKMDERERKRENRKYVAGIYVAQFLAGGIGQGLYQMSYQKKLRNRLT